MYVAPLNTMWNKGGKPTQNIMYDNRKHITNIMIILIA